MNGVEQVTNALLAARRERQAVPAAPLADALPDAGAAYAVQDAVAAQPRHSRPPPSRRAGSGGNAGLPESGVGHWWKSGGASLATLTHAALPAAGVRASPADLRDLHFNWRGIEAEIALRLARDVTPAQAAALGPSGDAALVDGMTVSIELVDSRWAEGAQAPALLKLADLQSHGALVLGAWMPFAPRDWSAQVCTVRIGQAPAQTFRGTHSLGDPATHLPQWLRHATRHGATVPAGTVVTTGTWCGLLLAQPGDLVQIAFEGIGEATVQL